MRIGSTRLSCHAVDCVMQKLQKIQVHICKRSVHVPICNPCKTEPTSIFLRMPRGCADGGEGLDQLRVSFRARINCLHLYAVKCYSKKRESKRGTSNSLTLQRRGEGRGGGESGPTVTGPEAPKVRSFGKKLGHCHRKYILLSFAK